QCSRPDFMVLAYPVITMRGPFVHQRSRTFLLGDAPDPGLVEELSNETRVTAETPPAFLFHTTEDPVVPVENSLAFYSAVHAAACSSDLHAFLRGTHGGGPAPTDPALSAWPGLLRAWTAARGLLRRNGRAADRAFRPDAPVRSSPDHERVRGRRVDGLPG